MQSKYGGTNTVSLSNFFAELDVRAYLMHPLHCATGSLIQAYKDKLGRQDQTWVGGSENRRYFIWRVEGLWVLVHNVGGVQLEVDQGVPKEMALEMFRLYLQRTGHNPSL